MGLFSRRRADQSGGTLAGERKAGSVDAGGSGSSPADLYPVDAGITFLTRQGVEAVAAAGNPDQFVPGVPRPQRVGVAQYQAAEYVDPPALGGAHSVIVNRPFVLGTPEVKMIPDPGTPVTRFRSIPARDAANPAPGGC